MQALNSDSGIVHSRIRRDMSFEEWLYLNYKTTPDNMLKVALVTGTHADYDKALAWYQERYRKQLNNEYQSYGNQITIADYIKSMED